MKPSKTTGLPGASKPAAKKAARRNDWEAVERDYRTGQFSLRELETKHGAAYADIARRAKKEGWTKDLAVAVRQATSAALIQQVTTDLTTKSQQTTTTVVMAAAEVNKQVILGQRSRVGQAIGVSMRMLAELDATTTAADQINAMFERITEDMDAQSLAAVQVQFKDFMRLHSRIGSAQKLMDALGKAQAMEDKAFGLSDAAPTPEKPAAQDWASKSAEEGMAAYLKLVHGQ